MINSHRYENLSQKMIVSITGFDKSVVSRIRHEKEASPQKTTKRGPKQTLTDSFFEQILEYATEQRKVGVALTLAWFHKTIASFSNNLIHVSDSTISKRLKKYHWHHIATQVRHPMQLDPQREYIISAFQQMIHTIIRRYNITPSQLHIMDETGLISTQIPRKTYAPHNELVGYVRCNNTPKRDTAVVTLTANGNGHLFYIEHVPKTVLKKGGETQVIKATKGVGDAEIAEWVKSFIKYAHTGDWLIMDNLIAHKNSEFLNFLDENSINYLFFPIRTADILSVLDNSFFGAFKNGLDVFTDSEDKKDKVCDRFQSMIEDNKVIPFFHHCKYAEMFPTPPTIPLNPKAVIDFMNDKSAKDWGVLTHHNTIEEYEYLSRRILGTKNEDSHIKCVISLFFYNPYLRSVLLASPKATLLPMKHIISNLMKFQKPSTTKIYQEFSEKFDDFKFLEWMLRKLDLSIHIGSYALEKPRKDMEKGYLLNYELRDDQTSYILYQLLLDQPFNRLIWPLQIMSTIPNLLFVKSCRQTTFELELKFDLGSRVQLSQNPVEVWYHLAHILIYEVDISKMHHVFKCPVQVNDTLQEFWYEQFTKPVKFVTCPIEFIPVYYKPDDVFVLVYELDDPSKCTSVDHTFPQVIQSNIESHKRYVIDTTTSSSSNDQFDDFVSDSSLELTDNDHPTKNQNSTSSQDIIEEEEEEILEEEEEIIEGDEAFCTYSPSGNDNDDHICSQSVFSDGEEEEMCEEESDSEQSFDFVFQDSSEDENYEEDCHDYLVNDLPASTSTFDGPTLCNPCDDCYINSSMQILYHIPELNQFLTNSTFPPSELGSIQHILQIMNRKLHYIKVSKLYTKENLPTIRKQSKDSGLVLQTVFSLISDFSKEGKHLIKALFEIKVTYIAQTEDASVITEKHTIINIYATNHHTNISEALSESLTKPGYTLQGITNNNQYLIFRLNRRYLERKNLYSIEFSNMFNLSGKDYMLKMMIVHHGIGEHGGHYFCLIRKNEEQMTSRETMLNSYEYFKISDKYASVVVPSLDSLSGNDILEERINNGEENSSVISSYDTAYILIYQQSTQ